MKSFVIYKKYIKYGQFNNEIDPRAACNATAMVQGSHDTGIDLNIKNDMQPEDAFMEILKSDSAEIYFKQEYPYAPEKSNPRNYSKILTHMMNEWVGFELVKRTKNATLSGIIKHLYFERGAVVVSTDFWGAGGHFITFVGIEGSDEFFRKLDNGGDFLVEQFNIIIKDPASERKYMSYSDVFNHVKPERKNFKTAQLFKKDGWE